MSKSQVPFSVYIVNDDEAALREAIFATPFSDDLKSLLFHELLEPKRFPTSFEGIFKCVDMSAPITGNKVLGAGPNDRLAHLVFGDDGKLVMLALRALGARTRVRIKSSHDDAPSEAERRLTVKPESVDSGL